MSTRDLRHAFVLVSALLLLTAAGIAAPARAARRQFVPPKQSTTGTSAPQKTAPGERKTSHELDIAGNQQWVDTGVDLYAGDRVLITATGELEFEQQKKSSPDGLKREWRDLIRILPMSDANRGALIGRVGDTAAAEAFLVGVRRDFRAGQAGRLFLGINRQASEEPGGKYHVKIQILEPGAAPGTAAGNAAAEAPKEINVAEIQGVTAKLFDDFPRRVADKDGTPGDMVNFLILGPEDKVRQAFQSAGWVIVDRTTKDTILRGALATLSKQSYVTLPMSELYLFDRAQDYGYAHAEPFAVVATRHHLRLWKAAKEVNGQTLWVGAGTHDVGFDRDQRTGKITHKIDPDVDKERDYIGDSLRQTGLVEARSYVTPADSLRQAKTAHGEEFHSDGRVLVLRLAGTSDDRSVAFGELFCAVLQQVKPDAGDWGACSQYLEGAQEGKVTLEPLSAQYRVLIVPGVMSSCASEAPAFQEGQEHLRKKYGMTVDLITMPNDSSENNAKLITSFLKEQRQKDPRKFILVGYSKGAPDAQVALAEDPEAAADVAAFISVAGAVGGSPIADVLPAAAERWMNALHLTNCQGDVNAAFKSLRRDVRQAFLARYPNPIVPSYSLAAVSEKSNTSKMLQQSWMVLAAYDTKQDSTLTKFDTLVPGGAYLGSARADHLAVALPFEFLTDSSIRAVMDQNHYPRAALLEALIRFVVQDLEKKK